MEPIDMDKEPRKDSEVHAIHQRLSVRTDQKEAGGVKIAPEVKSALVRIFDSFDTDKSGYLTFEEVIKAVHELDIFKSEEAENKCVREWFEATDTNADGRMSQDEFLGLMVEGMDTPLTEEDLRGAFDAFDADGSGTVSGDELKAALSSLGKEILTMEECDELIGILDKNGSGAIEFEEFLVLLGIKTSPLTAACP